VSAVSRSPTIGIDVGATKVVAAVVDADGSVLHRDTRVRTPSSSSSSLIGLLLRGVETLRERCPEVRGIGVGIAGLVHWPEGEVEFAANHDYRRVKLRARLQESCELPVVVDNDANAGTWAEARAGRNSDQGLLFLAVGTGLGSGFLVDGALMRGHGGRGAELGHLVVDRSSTRRCACGRVGCLETVASGQALVKAGHDIVRRDPRGSLARRAGRLESIDMRFLIDAALGGDPDVLAQVTAMGSRIGGCIADTMSLLPVQQVAVSGGLSALGRVLLDPMRSACEKALAPSRYLTSPRFALARYGQDSTVIGAAFLASDAVAGRPEPTMTLV
jgi:glucokinase